MRVSALCGSLRHGSYNQALLDTAVERALGHGLEIVQASIEGFPMFSQGAEAEAPPGVLAAKEIIRSSQCLLLVTPEHNYGVPGVPKNAVDWLSRSFSDPTLRGRPLALAGASTGHMGTSRRRTWGGGRLLRRDMARPGSALMHRTGQGTSSTFIMPGRAAASIASTARSSGKRSAIRGSGSISPRSSRRKAGAKGPQREPTIVISSTTKGARASVTSPR